MSATAISVPKVVALTSVHSSSSSRLAATSCVEPAGEDRCDHGAYEDDQLRQVRSKAADARVARQVDPVGKREGRGRKDDVQRNL